MRVKRGGIRSISGGQVSLISPWFHSLGVKREIGRKGHIYREKQQLSLLLSPFHPHPLAIRPPACIRVCEGVKGRIVKPAIGTSLEDRQGERRGNSRQLRQSLFSVSENQPMSGIRFFWGQPIPSIRFPIFATGRIWQRQH